MCIFQLFLGNIESVKKFIPSNYSKDLNFIYFQQAGLFPDFVKTCNGIVML